MMDPAVKRRNRELFALAKSRLNKAGKGSLDVIYLTHSEAAGADRNFFFATGIDSGSFLYSSAVMTQDGMVHLFVQELEEEEAKAAGLPYTLIRPGENTLFKGLKGHRTVGVNANAITLAEAGRFKDKKLALVNIAPDLEDARARKSKKEMDHIREASRIAAQAALDLPGMVEEGMTERELAAKMDYRMAELGSEGPAFDTIAAFGERTAIPHASPAGRKLKKGDYILCDYGATSGKMRSDITRVWCFGRASDAQKDLYNAILKIQNTALSALKIGESGKALHAAADSAVLGYFLGIKAPGRMGHSLGHSIGLYAHDGKRLSMAQDYVIPADFVTTIEPAGYLPGFGGVRIEDMAFVTRQGVENLTEKAPKNGLIEIAG